jgi:hypothetical protein
LKSSIPFLGIILVTLYTSIEVNLLSRRDFFCLGRPVGCFENSSKVFHSSYISRRTNSALSTVRVLGSGLSAVGPQSSPSLFPKETTDPFNALNAA